MVVGACSVVTSRGVSGLGRSDGRGRNEGEGLMTTVGLAVTTGLAVVTLGVGRTGALVGVGAGVTCVVSGTYTGGR